MSVKIKVSYKKPEELEKVLNLLHPAMKSYKIAKRQDGQFKKAYIEMK